MEENSLIAALRRAEAEKYAAVPAEDEIEHTFSDRFRQRMDRLIRLQRQSVWSMVKTPARRSLLLLLILLMVFGVPPEKNPLFRLAQPIPELSTVAPMEPPVSLRPDAAAGFNEEPALTDAGAAAQTEPAEHRTGTVAVQTDPDAWEPKITLGHAAPAPAPEPPAPAYEYTYTYVPETYYEPQAEWQDSAWDDTSDNDDDSWTEEAIARWKEQWEEYLAIQRAYTYEMYEKYNNEHSYTTFPSIGPVGNSGLPNGLPDKIYFSETPTDPRPHTWP